MMYRKLICTILLLLMLVSAVLGVSSLTARSDGRIGKASMERQSELKLNAIDVHDSAAMANWAHGMCRGQTVEHLAAQRGVEPTLDAVVEELSRAFPKEVQGAVARACKEELEKTKGNAASPQ